MPIQGNNKSMQMCACLLNTFIALTSAVDGIHTIKYLQYTVTASVPCVPLPRKLTGMQL